MALSVIEEIHNLCIGLLKPTLLMIKRATSSPSLPASVAMINSDISSDFNHILTLLNCLDVPLITLVSNFLGIIGRVSIFHSCHS